jgi:hypothetical protein
MAMAMAMTMTEARGRRKRIGMALCGCIGECDQKLRLWWVVRKKLQHRRWWAVGGVNHLH